MNFQVLNCNYSIYLNFKFSTAVDNWISNLQLQWTAFCYSAFKSSLSGLQLQWITEFKYSFSVDNWISSHRSTAVDNWIQVLIARRGSLIGSMFAGHALSSIPTSGTFFRGDWVMKTFLRPFSLFRWFKKNSCQLLAKECALSTGKLPRRLAQEQQCG